MAKKFLDKLPFTTQIVGVLLASSLLSLALLSARMVATGSIKFWFLSWNLFLAWLPVVFALGLRIHLSKKPLLDWRSIGLFVLWLGFLPNSFYIISDLIHLQSSGETAILFDIAMFMSFIINGLILGYISVYIIHSLLQKRLSNRHAWWVISGVFLACGLAIYIGRYLRWNTWDILFNPAGLIFDISERVVNPILHLETYYITLVFFVLLTVTYGIIYQIARLLVGDNLPKKK